MMYNFPLNTLKLEKDIIKYINVNSNNIYGYSKMYDNYHKATTVKLDTDSYKYINIDNVNVTNLMIVAHPDDEIIYGGYDLYNKNGWLVIYCTNDFSRFEMIEQTSKEWKFNGMLLNFIDSDRDEIYFHKNLYDKLYEIIISQHWENIITHNINGEYGHPQHIKVHKIVSNIIQNLSQDKKPTSLKTFNDSGKTLDSSLLEYKYKTIKEFYKRPPETYRGMNTTTSIKFESITYDMTKVLCV